MSSFAWKPNKPPPPPSLPPPHPTPLTRFSYNIFLIYFFNIYFFKDIKTKELWEALRVIESKYRNFTAMVR